MRRSRAVRGAALAVVVAAGIAGAAPEERPDGRAAESRADDDGASAGAAPRPAPERVDAAVARGVAWLRREQDRGGGFGSEPGETALCLLALRHSGEAAADPACARAAAALARDLPDGSVYGAALGLAALVTHDVAGASKKARALVADLVGAQCANGQWSYSTRGRAPGAGDNSNTQIAVFGLAAARARGIDVPRATFERTLRFFRSTRNDDGGWGYSERQRSQSYTSMTAGAAMAVALCSAVAEPGAPGRVHERSGVREGLGWLARHFEAGANVGAAAAFGPRGGPRGDGFWRHYTLWSVERLGAAADADVLGTGPAARRWHDEGTHHLLASQRDDGSWVGPERARVATAFALLFLRRASRNVLTPSGSGGPVTPR